MGQQLTYADSEFSNKCRQTRKEKFLGRIDKLIQWARLEAVIDPRYPKAGNCRRPYPLSTMLRIHCMQQWYNLSDPTMEDAQYEIASMRLLARLSLVDATIIETPSSTKNKAGECDLNGGPPEMNQTKKGNQWRFGVKAHIGVDARTGITQSLTTTAANEHDLNQAD